MFWAALVALAVGVVSVQGAVPELLIDLRAEDFVASPMAWENKGTLGGEFLPVGTGGGTAAATVAGVPAVSFTSGNRDAGLTNRVSPQALTGANPWSFEVWVYKPQIYANDEVAFTWTMREAWPSSGSAGSCMEFRYGGNTGNAVEHYSGSVSWNGPVPAVGQWHHVAVVRDAGGRERLFLNGVLRNFVRPALVNIRDDVDVFTLGGVMRKDNNSFDTPWRGSIARLRIYAGALSSHDVLANYLAECQAFNITPPAAVDKFWNGAPGTVDDWNTPANWSLNTVPVDGDNVFFENGGAAADYSDTRTFRGFQGHHGGLTMTGGKLTILDTMGATTYLGNTLGAFFELQVKGGTFELPGANTRFLQFGSNGGYGRAIVGGGSELAWVRVDRDLQIGVGSTSRGYAEVLANGLMTASNGYFYVAQNGGTGEVLVAGGTIRNERARFSLAQGGGAQGKITLNSGSVETMDDLYMSDGGNSSNLAEFHLNGGLLWLRKFTPTTAGRNYVYLNGGTLRNRDGRGDFMQNISGAYVQGGGVCFDVISNLTVDVSQPLLADPVSIGGGLTKTGSGTLNLRGANTFTGDVTVAQGSLIFRGASSLASGYKGNILVERGAAIGYEATGGANILLDRIDPASTGVLLLFNSSGLLGEHLDFSSHPGLSFSVSGGGTYTGNYTPYQKQYRFFVNGGSFRYDPAISDPDASLTVEAGLAGYLDLYGNSSYTNGTTISGGVVVMYHVNALGPHRPGVRDIGIYNGAGLMLNMSTANGATQQFVNDIISRIKLDSRGSIILGNDIRGFNYDLSDFPSLTLGAETGRDFNGTLISHPSIGGYHVGGGLRDWGTGGIRIRNVGDFPGGAPRKVVAQYQGSVELYVNNTFSGGIIASNNAAIWIREDAAAGAVPPAPWADYLVLNGACLRPDPTTLPMVIHPHRGITIDEGGACFRNGGNRFTAWMGDLHGSGTASTQDSGIIMFGGTNNTWNGVLALSNNNDDGTFSVGYGQNFSWVKTNRIEGNGMFGVSTDLDITWSDKFENPLGTAPFSFDVPDGISANVGLRKLGSGTLTLDVPGAYRRATRVDSGVLKIGAANAIPWGSGKGSLFVSNNSFFPAGTLDMNGFDVGANALMGGGNIIDSTKAGKTLTFGNNNANSGTLAFLGLIEPEIKVAKVGNGAQNFWKGMSMGDFRHDGGAVNAGAETVFGSVEVKTTSSINNTAFNVGLAATSLYGLTGEYYWFDYTGLQSLVDINNLLSLTAFETFLDSYAPVHVESSFSLGEGFDARWTENAGTANSTFQAGFNSRNYFYCRWTGEFYAEADGEYTFGTMSDDGSAVFVDRQPVVINSRMGSYFGSRRDGAITLVQGWHDIIIGYFQGSSERGLTVFMTPPGGEDAVLPQRLLRPYPVTVKSLAGVAGSRVEIRTNAALVVTGEADGAFLGQLLATAEDARLIKNGPGKLILGSPTPVFNGQAIVNGGILGLQGAMPFVNKPYLAAGTALAAYPMDDNASNRGLKGSYYPNNYNVATVTDIASMDAYFNSRQLMYVAYTTQTGGLAVADAPNFWYDSTSFPGPYVEIPNVQTATYFGIRFQGKFLALEPGDYTFGMISDDRLDMFLNGVQVITNSNAGLAEKLATVYLEPGTHDLQIAFGQGGGGYYVRPSLTCPGGEKGRLPNALLRSAVSTIHGFEGEGDIMLPSIGSYLCLNVGEPWTFSRSITGSSGSELEKNGAETLTLTGDNDGFDGTWYVMKGMLIAGDGNVSGTLGGEHVHVAAGAKLVFNRSDDIVYTGRVTGNGEISSIGGGRVTFTNFGDDFNGIFTSGEFMISGALNLPIGLFPQGPDPMTVWLEDGVRLLVPAAADMTSPIAPLIMSNATLSLQLSLTDAYYIDSLMIRAGGDVTIDPISRVTGLYGYFYNVTNNPVLAPNTVAPYLATVSNAEAFFANYPLLCKTSSWKAGETMDFAENGSLFPPEARAKGSQFGALWKGKIMITDPGEYTFITRSDDNSILFINDKVVVNSNMDHGMRDEAGLVELTVGVHDFALGYYQGGGSYGLRVSLVYPGQTVTNYLPNSMLIAHLDDLVGETLDDIPTAGGIPGTSFTLEIGTLGVVDGPGTGMLDITAGGSGAGDGQLLLNDLYIESPGAVLATLGETLVSGSNLHVIMGREPVQPMRFLVADFTGTPFGGLPLTGKTKSLEGVTNGKLDYKGGCLYISKAGGTLLILR